MTEPTTDELAGGCLQCIGWISIAIAVGWYFGFQWTFAIVGVLAIVIGMWPKEKGKK